MAAQRKPVPRAVVEGFYLTEVDDVTVLKGVTTLLAIKGNKLQGVHAPSARSVLTVAGNEAALAEALLAKVNGLRVERGLAPLTVNKELTVAALSHSQEMVSLNYFSHNSPSPGRTLPSDRAVAAGYSSYSILAQNVFKSFGGSDAGRQQRLVNECFKAWLDSENLNNMLGTAEVGIGVATNSAKETYITALLASPTGSTSGAEPSSSAPATSDPGRE